MRKSLLIAIAATSFLSSPAMAKDGSGYAGIDIGVIWPKSQDVLGLIDYTNPLRPDFSETDIGTIKYKEGIDFDIFGGYDFGIFRVEGELGYKHGTVKHREFSSAFINALIADGQPVTADTDFGIDDKTNVWDAMLNGWLDLGGNGGFGGGVGAGVGYAGVHQFGRSSSHFAWQLLADAYYPVNDNIDIGLKYRYFHAGTSDGTHQFVFSAPTVCNALPPAVCSGGVATFEDRARFTSHSLLLTVAYNFGSPPPPPPPPLPPPPPPPPPPPATTTCPDGTVIPATDTCPAPPPPPAPPAPERGQ